MAMDHFFSEACHIVTTMPTRAAVKRWSWVAALALVVVLVIALVVTRSKEMYTDRPCHVRYGMVLRNRRAAALTDEFSDPAKDPNPTRSIIFAIVLKDDPPRPAPYFDKDWGNMPQYLTYTATAADKHPRGAWFAKPGQLWKVQVSTTGPDGKASICQGYQPTFFKDWCNDPKIPVCKWWPPDSEEIVPARRYHDRLPPPK